MPLSCLSTTEQRGFYYTSGLPYAVRLSNDETEAFVANDASLVIIDRLETY